MQCLWVIQQLLIQEFPSFLSLRAVHLLGLQNCVEDLSLQKLILHPEVEDMICDSYDIPHNMGTFPGRVPALSWQLFCGLSWQTEMSCHPTQRSHLLIVISAGLGEQGKELCFCPCLPLWLFLCLCLQLISKTTAQINIIFHLPSAIPRWPPSHATHTLSWLHCQTTLTQYFNNRIKWRQTQSLLIKALIGNYLFSFLSGAESNAPTNESVCPWVCPFDSIKTAQPAPLSSHRVLFFSFRESWLPPNLNPNFFNLKACRSCPCPSRQLFWHHWQITVLTSLTKM